MSSFQPIQHDKRRNTIVNNGQLLKLSVVEEGMAKVSHFLKGSMKVST